MFSVSIASTPTRSLSMFLANVVVLSRSETSADVGMIMVAVSAEVNSQLVQKNTTEAMKQPVSIISFPLQ